jgi:hypothetical protein
MTQQVVMTDSTLFAWAEFGNPPTEIPHALPV